MTTSYRETALACPGCGEMLDPKEVGDAIIDVCPGCGGVWVDWFDGELVTMIKGAPRVAGARVPETPGSSSCPRCRRPLDAERYLESRAEILRCGDCAGAFVPRVSISALVVLDPARANASKNTDPLARLGEVLQRWLGWKEPEDR